MSFILEIDSPDAMRELGACLGAGCRGGEVLLLSGPLGAGKTCFAQGLAQGLGVPESEHVTSPTFVLHVQYAGRLLFNHIDAYRLGGADQPDPGLDEFFGAPGSVCAAEWSEFLPHVPHEHLGVHIAITGERTRRIRLTPVGALHAEFLARSVPHAG